MLPIPGQFRSGSHIEQVQNSGVIVVTDDELSIVLEFRPGDHDGKKITSMQVPGLCVGVQSVGI